MKRIAELDGVRAVAALMVVLDHCQTMAPVPGVIGAFANGGLGVTIFFVLSGYLITRLLIDEQSRTGTIRLRDFYIRRVLRILPASYSYLLVVAAVALAGLVQVTWQQWLVTFAHIWNYSQSFLPNEPAQGGIILGHFWSLAVEEQFYWIWPLTLLLVAGRRAKLFLFAIVASMAWIRLGTYFLMPSQRGALTMMFHTSIDPIAMGALLAFYEVPLRDRIARLNRFWISLGIALLLLASPMLHHFLGAYWGITYGRTIDAALSGVLILAMIYRPEHGFAWAMRNPVLQFLGKISFSLYLWQQAFCIRGGMFAVRPLFAIPLSILVATLSFYAIEQPFQRLRRRIWVQPILGVEPSAQS